MTDPKLVEALAAFMYRCARRFFNDSAPLWADLTPSVRDRWVAHAERMVEEHRLVQLPEEADVWQVEWIEHELGRDPWMSEPSREVAERVVRDPVYHDATTGRVRPVYTHYGDPVYHDATTGRVRPVYTHYGDPVYVRADDE